MRNGGLFSCNKKLSKSPWIRTLGQEKISCGTTQIDANAPTLFTYPTIRAPTGNGWSAPSRLLDKISFALPSRVHSTGPPRRVFSTPQLSVWERYPVYSSPSSVYGSIIAVLPSVVNSFFIKIFLYRILSPQPPLRPSVLMAGRSSTHSGERTPPAPVPPRR